MSAGDKDDAAKTSAVVTIKKYANRRLYNTASSSYVTLDTLSRMVKNGENFVVYDAKSGEDITRSVLTQIIFEEEAKGENLLPINFLRQLIQFYGAPMQGFLPGYLEMSLETFARNQEQMRAHMNRAAAPFDAMQAMARSNMAWLESAMGMFAPFNTPQGPGNGSGGAAPSKEAGAGADPGQSAASIQPPPRPAQATREIDLLRDQMAAMQAALENLTMTSGAPKRPKDESGDADG